MAIGRKTLHPHRNCPFPQTRRDHFSLLTLHELTSPAFFSLSGIAVRLWQLGIEMRPIFQRESLWVYPLFATVGGSFGYWLEGVESRQLKMLSDRKSMLLEKRRRRAAREAQEPVGLSKVEEGGLLASTS
ncbi:hypothetical protein AJ80_07180 [Polytolypa hystricis UAMH7299]|uniref:NADH-ubiquinone oxidoreductase 14 kDa subunit n=1 Tax=Polytolypa hystricis (strain UAMH7299) TaxID=1447883 RepID=A0A2B7XR92_POLH7|nr:hypothetical protein AJ80_07180 [Polytolypa hystricis UAMH7299]